ncbi:unnamed protein product [Candidula unifasciata]|uniref:Major royal jelly protein n=1 Tax=Candidula unifasciata TaxID=100452 RepID=A0A8S3ZE18_9EUPU|nr:unnamed protein product [Candidula unifasciata]
MMFKQKTKILLLMPTLLIALTRGQTFGQSVLVHEWSNLEFEWPSQADKEESIKNNTYVPERNLLAGIKVYKGEVYVTIPRWFWPNGHPATLAKIVTVNNRTLLRPYPNWAAQKQGNCESIQFSQSMEIDSNKGHMYVIDTGRVGNTLNLCPAKIIVYDLNTDNELNRYIMPADVVNRTTNYLNDIVLDYVNGSVRYAYVTEANEGSLLVYDFQTRHGYKLEDQSMKAEEGNASIITINGTDYSFPFPMNGIAMSPDFKYVYYSAVAAFGLYQVPTATLRKGTDKTGIRRVGTRVSQTGGLTHGSKRLYYGASALNALYYWDIEQDVAEQKLPLDQVIMKTQLQLVKDDVKMQWPDTFGFDQEGWLWFVSNRLPDFNRTVGMIDDGNPYIRVWKVFVNETGYLYQGDIRTQEKNGGCKPMILQVAGLPVLLLSALVSSLLVVYASMTIFDV